MTLDIHLCGDDEIVTVERFLDQHWATGHILAHHRPLMDWQHRQRDGAGYNFVLATEAGCDEPLAILGFIPTSLYDPDLRPDDTLWLTTWMTRPGVAHAGLGLRLHRHLLRTVPARGVGTVGNNQRAAGIYRALRYHTGTLTQYYLLDPGRSCFHLAVAKVGEVEPPAPGATALVPLDAAALTTLEDRFDLGARRRCLPCKSPRYFQQRYLSHPLFDYEVYGLERAERLRGLVAVRVAEHDGARALRIVDYLGPPTGLADSGGAFLDLLRRHDAEYADCFCYGLPDEAFTAAGFRRLDPAGALVIPSHYEPFERRNIEIRFAFHRTADVPFVLFKADADQDRPNRLPAPL